MYEEFDASSVTCASKTSRVDALRQAFRTFAKDVDATLYFLSANLRASLLHSGDPRVERYQLVNVETDRVANSLNTLALEILQWVNSDESWC